MKTLDELTFKALEYAYNQGHIDAVEDNNAFNEVIQHYFDLCEEEDANE